ncbi:MAG: carboxylating nicotinate-nucleotide diphosphorylase [Oscillospiraceae bacterium]|nr:carboxylating nicotinate-nucleotide diphosphorylase [Oscillospiraceae bacterium]
MQLEAFLRAALDEDIGWGDITTEVCVPADTLVAGRFIAKADLVVCGLDIVKSVFGLLSDRILLTPRAADGDAAEKGRVIADITGPAHGVLMGERVALNLLQRMSGIATRTREFCRALEGTSARVADTRKTTPGMRSLEKYAVRVGGGSNHRMGLSDGVLIKDNHIAAAGGITAAVRRARAGAPHTLKIEVETTNLDEVAEALNAGADIIMFDNMQLEQMAEAVRLIGGRALTEASGNMGDKDASELVRIASAGVDIISIGALTHTVRAADISLRVETL